MSNVEEIKMNYPFVSVILPVYNGERYIKKCLESLMNQSYPKDKYEVIVIDNGSSDSTVEILKTITNSQIQVLYESKRGSYAARNTGVSHSEGEILAFIDSDCVADNNWLMLGVYNLKLINNQGVIGGRVEFFSDITNSWGVFDTATFLNQEKAVKSGTAVTANLFVPKEIFLKIGLFDDELQSGGDVEWTKRCKDKGYILKYCSEVLVYHPVRSSFKELSKKCFRVGYGNGQILRKNKRFYAIIKPSVSIPVIKKFRNISRQFKTKEQCLILRLVGVVIIMQIINYYGKLKGFYNLQYPEKFD